jgi:integrase
MLFAVQSNRQVARAIAWTRLRGQREGAPSVSASLGHSSARTTAHTYGRAIRDKDHAAARFWDGIVQRTRAGKSEGVNLGSR